MRCEFRFVDMAAAPEGGPPSVIVERQGGRRWWAAAGPVDQKPEWVPTYEGNHVRITLFRYHTNGRLPATALAYAFELGLKAALSVARHGAYQKAYLVIGNQVNDLAAAGGEDALEFWLGVALQE